MITYILHVKVVNIMDTWNEIVSCINLNTGNNTWKN